jgi:hypothetical protein
MSDIVNRLRFDATRCEATFSKGVAGNITEAADEIERLRTENSLLRATTKELRALAETTTVREIYLEWRKTMTASEFELAVFEAGYSRGMDARSGVRSEEVARQVERMGRCVTMAMRCLDPLSENPDEALAWHRLLDAIEGNEPRASVVGLSTNALGFRFRKTGGGPSK